MSRDGARGELADLRKREEVARHVKLLWDAVDYAGQTTPKLKSCQV
jgi:hypothetical protein